MRQILLVMVVIAINTVSGLILGGCETTDDILPPPMQPTPLAVDPIAQPEVIGWWHARDRLLHLRPDGHYEVYQGHRYGEAIERGYWARVSYARMMLEPYRILDPQQQRWTLTRDDDALQMRRDGVSYHFLGPPPQTIEDDLIGQWSGERQQLLLRDDMRFVWRRTSFASSQSGVTGAVQGRWSVRAGVLVLSPDGTAFAESEIAILRDTSGVDDETPLTLVSEAGALTREE